MTGCINIRFKKTISGKKCRILLSSIFFFIMLFPLKAQQLAPGKYWVKFTDKENSAYSIANPADFLSQRAIQRRENNNIQTLAEDLPVSGIYLDSLRSLGIKVIGASRWFNAAIIQSNDSLLLDTLTSLSFIHADFDPDIPYFKMLATQEIGVSAEKDLQSPLPSGEDYGASGEQINLLKGDALHNLGYLGEGSLIAVLDAGFYNVDSLEVFNHLWNENLFLGYKDFVDPGSDFFTHSTHGLTVLGTMAAYDPGYLIGTAPKASYLLLRSEETASEYRIEEAYWVLAAEYADSAGADVINSSLGYNDFDDDNMNYSLDMLDGQTTLITKAAQLASDKGIVVVVSAGNEGNNPNWQKITPPADAPGVIAVGAMDNQLNISGFSSIGPTADGRIKPDVIAVGYRTKSINSSGFIVNSYGTSFAAPQVAGLAACLLQAMPHKSSHDISQAIIRSASRYQNPDNKFGYGIPNFVAALYELMKDEENDPEEYIRVAPNPFTDHVWVSFINIKSPVKQIHVYSSSGVLHYSEYGHWENGALFRSDNLSTLQPGIYFMLARTKENEIVVRLIKQ